MTKYMFSGWLVAALAAAGGCKAAGGVGAGSSTGEGQLAGTGGGSTPVASCDTPEDHCLLPEELLVGDSAFSTGYVVTQVGTQTAAPNSAGEAAYFIVADGSTKTTKYSFRSHRATPAEVQLGALVAALDHADNGIYRTPRTRQEATSANWFVARIVSVDPVAHGHVVVSGGYKVAVDALRIVDGDNSPRLATPGPEDKWFVKPEHWLVGSEALPESGYQTVRLAVAIAPPSPATKGEGDFYITSDGARLWSKHAWRTRVATPADLKLGALVIALDQADDSVYRAPTSRDEALSSNWFAAKITDTSELFKGVVTLAGNYRTNVEGLRVPVR